MPRVEVTRTYLELLEPGDLVAASSSDHRLRLERVQDCPSSHHRYPMREVAGRRWVDRLAGRRRPRLPVSPTVGLWVLYRAGAPAGYFGKRHETPRSRSPISACSPTTRRAAAIAGRRGVGASAQGCAGSGCTRARWTMRPLCRTTSRGDSGPSRRALCHRRTLTHSIVGRCPRAQDVVFFLVGPSSAAYSRTLRTISHEVTGLSRRGHDLNRPNSWRRFMSTPPRRPRQRVPTRGGSRGLSFRRYFTSRPVREGRRARRSSTTSAASRSSSSTSRSRL
jgi:hypothetical protein